MVNVVVTNTFGRVVYIFLLYPLFFVVMKYWEDKFQDPIYLRTNSEIGISLGQTHNLELGQIPNSILL